MKTPVLHTQRVTLRPLLRKDAKQVFNNWTSDDDVSKYVRWNTHCTIEETEEWLTMEEEMVDGGNYNFGFVLKENGLLFGSGGLHYCKEHECYELGYNIMKNQWGKGLTTEIAKRVLEFARDDLKVSKIYVCHAVENIASEKIIKKLGFEFYENSSYQSFDGLKQFNSKTYFLEL